MYVALVTHEKHKLLRSGCVRRGEQHWMIWSRTTTWGMTSLCSTDNCGITSYKSVSYEKKLGCGINLFGQEERVASRTLINTSGISGHNIQQVQHNHKAIYLQLYSSTTFVTDDRRMGHLERA